MDAVDKMCAALDRFRSGQLASDLPAKAYARQSYLDAIERSTGMVRDSNARPPEGAMAAFAGMPVYKSEILPQGVLCVFLDKDNKIVGRVVDDTYVPPTPTEEHASNKSGDSNG